MQIQPKFQGVSVVQATPESDLSVFIRGSHIKASSGDEPWPYDMSVLDLNSAGIIQDNELKILSEKLEAGESVDEKTVRTTLLSVLSKAAFDFSPLAQEGSNAIFQRTIHDSFKALVPKIMEVISNGTLTFEPETSQARQDNDVFVSIR